MSTAYRLVIANTDETSVVETLGGKYESLTDDYMLLVRRTSARIALRLRRGQVRNVEYCRAIIIEECSRSFSENFKRMPLLALACTRQLEGLRDYLAGFPTKVSLEDLSFFVFRLDIEEFLIRHYGPKVDVLVEYCKATRVSSPPMGMAS